MVSLLLHKSCNASEAVTCVPSELASMVSFPSNGGDSSSSTLSYSGVSVLVSPQMTDVSPTAQEVTSADFTT